MYTRVLTPLCLLLANAGRGLASTWAVFSDASCAKSIETVVGQNGYPDGVCTSIADSSPSSSYLGFMFITLDEGCSPTIYQANTDSDPCSGYPIVASVATCYNTSWIYYSIDMCSKAAATATSSSSTSLSSSTSTSSSSATASSGSVGVISDGAIAGAVVGSVCGLAIIAAVSAFFFWFRPNQQRRKKREQDEIRLTSVGAESGKKYDDQRDPTVKPIEMHHEPPELPSPAGTTELPGVTSKIAEMHEEKGRFELPPESSTFELPGDHDYHTNNSNQSQR